jgi:hypothetical protein
MVMKRVSDDLRRHCVEYKGTPCSHMRIHGYPMIQYSLLCLMDLSALNQSLQPLEQDESKEYISNQLSLLV